MFYNMFNEPKPKGFVELNEALAELGMDPDECAARIEFNTDEGMFAGFTAEIMDNDGNTLGTQGYESRDQLWQDLEALGIAITED